MNVKGVVGQIKLIHLNREIITIWLENPFREIKWCFKLVVKKARKVIGRVVVEVTNWVNHDNEMCDCEYSTIVRFGKWDWFRHKL